MFGRAVLKLRVIGLPGTASSWCLSRETSNMQFEVSTVERLWRRTHRRDDQSAPPGGGTIFHNIVPGVPSPHSFFFPLLVRFVFVIAVRLQTRLLLLDLEQFRRGG